VFKSFLSEISILHTLLQLLYQFYSVLKNREHHGEISLTVFKLKYCFLDLVVGRKILWYLLQVKNLAGLINPSLPLAGNILSRVVHFIYLHCPANGTRRFPTFSNPTIVPVNHS
jgi:hypothetical protein